MRYFKQANSKIFFCYLLLLGITEGYAATATVTYTATIVNDASISVTTQPSFGSFYITGLATTGTASLANTGNTITTTASSALAKISGTGAASGAVTVTGVNGAAVALTLPSVTMTSGANNFVVTPTLGTATCTIGTSCSGIGIGGSFPYPISASIVAGSYTGNGTLTVLYQ